MNAQDGHVYAQIVDGKYHWRFTKTELPEWQDAAFEVVDITGNEPNVGDTWNGAVFTAPAPIPPVSGLTLELLATALKIKGVLTDTEIEAAKK